VSEVVAAWKAIGEPWQAAFEEAWTSWAAGCFGIGCVLVDDHRSIVARGRNRVLERALVPGLLAETLIAHAEMNALAALDLDRGTGEDFSLYTTMEPCLMCASTIVMVRIGHVHYAVADPMFDGLHEVLTGHPYCAERAPQRHGPLDGPLAAFAGLLPLIFNMTGRRRVGGRASTSRCSPSSTSLPPRSRAPGVWLASRPTAGPSPTPSTRSGATSRRCRNRAARRTGR
jgi:tRNA(adenine34) deaminase